jgi:hypothetical protein
LLKERKARRLLWEYGSGETPQAQAPRRLAETPTESEAPGAEINRQVRRFVFNKRIYLYKTSLSNYSNKYRFYYKGKDIKKNVYIL